MAIRKIETNQTATGWNSRTFFPKDTYILRCISEKVAPNNNGNPMVTLEWEIVNQEPKQIGDKLVEFDGVKFSSYHVIKNVDTALDDAERQEKSDKCFLSYQERVLVPCGIDVTEGWDDENPPTIKGKVVHASVYGKENKSYKSPTPEEQAQGKRVGEVIKDPITQKEVIVYQPNIETIFGLFDGEVVG